MRIDKIKVAPVPESINPELVFCIEMLIQGELEIPIEISGCLFSDNNKKIANIHQVLYESNRNFELSARDDRRNEGEEKLTIHLIAPLNQKVLDYIETLREKNKKGDIILNIDVHVKVLVSKARISNMYVMKEGSSPVPLPEEYKDFEVVFYSFKERLPRLYTDVNILSGDNGSTFIEVKHINYKEKITIPSSDWIHDYCPIFQIGKFSVVEYLLPEYTEGSGSIEERLNESINAIKRMKDALIKGEWNEVIEDSRGIWELLRNQEEIKDLLIGDGYSEDAFKDLNESLKQLFNYSSKFHHKEDRGKKIMPEIKASKEDAYLIYTMSINVVNLISKKMRRLSIRQPDKLKVRP